MSELTNEERRIELLSSLMLFTKVFYQERTGREFIVSEPIGRESHHITICKELTLVFQGKTGRLLINVPPGYAKSELLIHFIAWSMAHYPDSNFLYVSYSSELAAQHTYTIKQIMQLPLYREIFGIRIKHDSSAKDNFSTEQGGTVKAFGSAGSIVGQNAGLPYLDRFCGAVVMDDMHKPAEVHSDLVRQRVITNFNETLKQRVRGANVPFIFLGQRLHEDDLPAYFIDSRDGYEWKKVILKALDDAGNPLNPLVHSKERLLIEMEVNPYTFYSQFQQTPQPPGGGLFKKSDIVVMDKEPEILATFITVDSAETDKTINDPCVFSFWGIHKINLLGRELNLYGLHLIHCLEKHIDAGDLESEFSQFLVDCHSHAVPPTIAAIEKKSTGVTMCAVLRNKPGLQIIEINRDASSGSKIDRYISIQRYVGAKLISVLSSGKMWTTKDNKPQNLFIEHIGKITANGTHKRDDITDTFYDAVQLALVKKVILNMIRSNDDDDISGKLLQNYQLTQQLRAKSYGIQR